WGIPEDWDEALKWYRRAADLGYGPATARLAELSEKIRKREAKASQPAPRESSGGPEGSRTADATAGEASGATSRTQAPQSPAAGTDAQTYDRHMKAGRDALLAGRKDAAEDSFRAALEARPDDPEASYLIGKLCFDAKRYREAERFYRIAAEKDHTVAQNALGRMYAIGYGPVLSQKEEARKWFQKAAAKNDPEGLFNMGQVYELGWGIPEDWDEALKWYRRAADLGYGPAAGKIAEIERRRKNK
ncbi:MAG: tetratricopeptide repeat protein, partial [Planctomycetota bacterium]|nr:tetratricopeptide repeat protein [Planctomycetota bacterium]